MKYWQMNTQLHSTGTRCHNQHKYEAQKFANDMDFFNPIIRKGWFGLALFPGHIFLSSHTAWEWGWVWSSTEQWADCNAVLS